MYPININYQILCFVSNVLFINNCFVDNVPNLILRLQFQSLHWLLGFIKISPFCVLFVSDIFWQVLKSSDSWWQHEFIVCALRHKRSSWQFSKSWGLSASISFLPLGLPLFPLFGSCTLFHMGKKPKIPFLRLSLLPDLAKMLAMQTC